MPHRVPPRPPRLPSASPGRAGAGMRSGDWGGVRLGPDTDLTGISFNRIDRGTLAGRPLVYAETVLLAVGMLAGLVHGRGLRGSVRDTMVGYGIASYLAQWAGELERRQ